jgi:hypothetical protein
VRGDRIELLLALGEIGRQRLEPRRTLLEVERQQRAHAARASVGQRLAEVDRLRMRVRDGAAVDGAGERLRRLRAEPAPGDVALKKR